MEHLTHTGNESRLASCKVRYHRKRQCRAVKLLLHQYSATGHINISLIPHLHNQANIKQSASKHQGNIEQMSTKYEACIKHSLHEAIIKRQANIKQLEHASCTCILNTFAWCLLDCVNGVLLLFRSNNHNTVRVVSACCVVVGKMETIFLMNSYLPYS